ncbi:unnamed protein product [Trichobilharzia regenti]|nr:unnamed protein product [Trichobilharzia regenti]
MFSANGRSKTPVARSANERRRRQIEETAYRLLEHFHQKTVDTLTKLVHSLNPNESVQLYFSCYAQLCLPTILIYPSIDDFQKALNNVVHLIISVMRHIPMWDLKLRGPLGHKVSLCYFLF